MKVLQRIFVYILLFIVLTIGIVTILAFMSQKVSTQNENFKITDNFFELEKLRLVTNDEQKVIIVLKPFFSYKMASSEFQEELYRKKSQITSIFYGYFSKKTFSELKNLGETALKNDLLALINQELVLGKIEKLLFKEYVFIN